MLLLSAFGKEAGSSACDEFHIKYLDLVIKSNRFFINEKEKRLTSIL